MLSTSQGGCKDYVKLNIWYKVLSTVLGVPYVVNKYGLLSLSTTLITVKTFNNSLVPQGKSPMPPPVICGLHTPAPAYLQPHVCHDNPSSKPLGPSPRADPSSRLGLAVYPSPFILHL